MEETTISKLNTANIEVGTSCLICGGFVHLGYIPASVGPRICDECRKRLYKLLYPERPTGHD